MRINIYAEELTDETELVTKEVVNERIGNETFYAVRMYLASPDVLHSTADDDDRSAITFWVPWTKKNMHDFAKVVDLLEQMADTLRATATQLGHDIL